MAEKEERTKDIIYVFSQELICKNCKDWYEHIDPLDKTDCDNCEDIADLPHISRQQAIEKMARAIATPFFEGAFSCENEAIEEYAKAALNALLGE